MNDTYTTIRVSGTGEYIEKKSKFIGEVHFAKTLPEAEAFLQAVKDAFISRSSTLSLQDQTYFVQADIKKDNEARPAGWYAPIRRQSRQPLQMLRRSLSHAVCFCATK